MYDDIRFGFREGLGNLAENRRAGLALVVHYLDQCFGRKNVARVKEAAATNEEGTMAAKPPSKVKAVTKALEVLGADAKPPEIGNFVLQEFGLTMKPNMISSYKSQILGKKKKGTKGGRIGRPPGSTSAVVSSGNISMKDLQEIKSLAGRLGIGNLRKLVEVLA